MVADACELGFGEVTHALVLDIAGSEGFPGAGFADAVHTREADIKRLVIRDLRAAHPRRLWAGRCRPPACTSNLLLAYCSSWSRTQLPCSRRCLGHGALTQDLRYRLDCVFASQRINSGSCMRAATKIVCVAQLTLAGLMCRP